MAILEATGISKRFGGVVALDRADFRCEAGEIHALLGENGAGKSTMVKILTGVLEPDEGEIRFRGRPIRLSGPAEASRLGIAPVFQELSLMPHLTVAQNVFIGREPRGPLGLIRFREMAERTAEIFRRLGIDDIDVDRPVNELALADRQLVEIAKALSHDPDVLFVDEGTSALGPQEVRRLFNVLRHLRAEGKAIVFISHRMGEIRELVDRATIFRDGRHVGTVSLNEVPESAIVEMMIGRKLSQSFPPKMEGGGAGRPLLEVQGLGWEDRLHDITFTLHEGEVLGLAGLEGQGQGDLLLALFGVYAGLRGEVRVGGRPLRAGSPKDAVRTGTGIALVPQDRKTEGLLLPVAVRENLVLANLHRTSPLGVVNTREEQRQVAHTIQKMQLKVASPEQPASALSGGNQQKVVIGKWLLTDASVYLLYDPTRGIDVGTKQEIYHFIRELAAAGRGLLLYSTDLSELIGLCDRVMVMYGGRVVDVLAGDQLVEANLIRAAFGMANGVADGRKEGGERAG